MQDPGIVARRRRSTAHSRQEGEHARSALHKTQAGSTETWRLKHKIKNVLRMDPPSTGTPIYGAYSAGSLTLWNAARTT